MLLSNMLAKKKSPKLTSTSDQLLTGGKSCPLDLCLGCLNITPSCACFDLSKCVLVSQRALVKTRRCEGKRKCRTIDEEDDEGDDTEEPPVDGGDDGDEEECESCEDGQGGQPLQQGSSKPSPSGTRARRVRAGTKLTKGAAAKGKKAGDTLTCGGPVGPLGGPKCCSVVKLNVFAGDAYEGTYRLAASKISDESSVYSSTVTVTNASHKDQVLKSLRTVIQYRANGKWVDLGEAATQGLDTTLVCDQSVVLPFAGVFVLPQDTSGIGSDFRILVTVTTQNGAAASTASEFSLKDVPRCASNAWCLSDDGVDSDLLPQTIEGSTTVEVPFGPYDVEVPEEGETPICGLCVTNVATLTPGACEENGDTDGEEDQCDPRSLVESNETKICANPVTCSLDVTATVKCEPAVQWCLCKTQDRLELETPCCIDGSSEYVRYNITVSRDLEDPVQCQVSAVVTIQLSKPLPYAKEFHYAAYVINTDGEDPVSTEVASGYITVSKGKHKYITNLCFPVDQATLGANPQLRIVTQSVRQVYNLTTNTAEDIEESPILVDGCELTVDITATSTPGSSTLLRDSIGWYRPGEKHAAGQLVFLDPRVEPPLPPLPGCYAGEGGLAAQYTLVNEGSEIVVPTDPPTVYSAYDVVNAIFATGPIEGNPFVGPAGGLDLTIDALYTEDGILSLQYLILVPVGAGKVVNRAKLLVTQANCLVAKESSTKTLLFCPPVAACEPEVPLTSTTIATPTIKALGAAMTKAQLKAKEAAPSAGTITFMSPPVIPSAASVPKTKTYGKTVPTRASGRVVSPVVDEADEADSSEEEEVVAKPAARAKVVPKVPKILPGRTRKPTTDGKVRVVPAHAKRASQPAPQSARVPKVVKIGAPTGSKRK